MPALPADAPKDRPVDAAGRAEVEAYKAAIAPYVARARDTWPQARARYERGLPPGQTFFAVTMLRDNKGAEEQVFVVVAAVRGDRVLGRIDSDLRAVAGFRHGDPYDFAEADLIDWLISRPDGSEEGNVVGKFLDEWQKTRPPTAASH